MSMKFAAVAALALAVSACGYNRDDRVSGGAAAGAATGAAIGLVGGPPGVIAGAAIGGIAGGVTGAATTPDEVNLGAPPWSERRGRGARSARAGASSGAVMETQRALAARGFDPGPTDGVMGAQTQRALADYQRSSNLPVTGQADPATRAALEGRGQSSSVTPR